MSGPSSLCVWALPSPVRDLHRHRLTTRRTLMKQLIAHWLWRAALLGVLCWIAWELHGIHGDMMLPAEEPSTEATAPDDLQNSLDDLRDDVATLNAKVDAMMMAMLQLRR